MKSPSNKQIIHLFVRQQLTIRLFFWSIQFIFLSILFVFVIILYVFYWVVLYWFGSSVYTILLQSTQGHLTFLFVFRGANLSILHVTVCVYQYIVFQCLVSSRLQLNRNDFLYYKLQCNVLMPPRCAGKYTHLHAHRTSTCQPLHTHMQTIKSMQNNQH